MTLQARLLCSIALVVATLAPGLALADAKFIYLTRHAEKSATGTDPELTPEGKVRAQNIAAALKKAGITSIYSTNYVRTKQTAQPLSDVLSVPVQMYDPTQIAAFAAQIKALPGNTLVVGHSDTTPDLIRQLGGDTVPAIAETEFDRLYQVAIGQDGDVTTTLMNSLPSVTVTPCAPVALNKTSLSAAKDAWIYFTITVPECANTLNVAMSGGTGDGDMYVRFGAQPTATDYSCRPYKTGNAETCPVVSDPQAGVWYIGIRAYAAFSGVTLNASANP
jgi:broad specificity phosphatase PhoE